MNQRERTLMMLLGVIGVVAVCAAAYLLVLGPIEDARADADRLETELSERDAKLNNLNKDRPKMEAAKKRSLPADVDTARVEYQAMLRQLLTKAGVPAGFTITVKETLDTRTTPLLDTKTKKPAYTRIGFEVQMQKVDVGMLVKFLEGYYKLNLLHQITRLDIARKDETGGKGKPTERNDLTVTLLTEGIILDGAENRRTLLPVPFGAALVGGNAGYHALMNSSEAGRNITPTQFAPVLAVAKPEREYLAIGAKNFIHGTIPPPPKPKPVVQEEVKVAPPTPKEDISRYIKLTGITREPNGGATAGLYDVASNHIYEVTMTPKAEKFEIKVEKKYILNGKYRLLDSWSELVIAEPGTSTNRKFAVVGWSGEDLILTEAITAGGMPAPPEKVGGNGKPAPSGRDKKPALPAAPPAAGLIGGALVATAPVGEKVYAWRVGQSLKSLAELPSSEARDAIRRAYPNHATAGTSNAAVKLIGD